MHPSGSVCFFKLALLGRQLGLQRRDPAMRGAQLRHRVVRLLLAACSAVLGQHALLVHTRQVILALHMITLLHGAAIVMPQHAFMFATRPSHN